MTRKCLCMMLDRWLYRHKRSLALTARWWLTVESISGWATRKATCAFTTTSWQKWNTWQVSTAKQSQLSHQTESSLQAVMPTDTYSSMTALPMRKFSRAVTKKTRFSSYKPLLAIWWVQTQIYHLVSTTWKCQSSSETLRTPTSKRKWNTSQSTMDKHGLQDTTALSKHGLSYDQSS